MIVARRRSGPCLQLRPGRSALQPAHADRRQLAERSRTRSTSTPPRRARSTSRSGDEIGVVARGPVRAVQDRRHGQVRRRVLARRRDDRGVHAARPPRRSSTRSGSSTRSTSPPSQGVSPTKLVAGDPAAAAAERPGRDRPGAGAAGHQGHRGFLTIFQDFLLAFGGIALFVGSFVIANTLSITVAQRTRELATLRTLGATRRQVRASVMLEALVIGVVASVIGLFLGLGAREGPELRCSSRSGSTCPRRARCSRRGRSSSRSSSASWSRCSPRCGRRSGRRACRRSPRFARARCCRRRRFERFGAYRGARHDLRRRGADADRPARELACRQACGCCRSGSAPSLVFVGVSMLAPRLVPPLVRVLGWPAKKFGGGAGEARAGQLAPQPGADRDDRVGADDRARAGHAGRRARGRSEVALSRVP